MTLRIEFPPELAAAQGILEKDLAFSTFAAGILGLQPLKFRSDSTHVLVAGQPKSASTFVYRTLERILNLNPIQMGEPVDLGLVAQEVSMEISDKISGSSLTHSLSKPMLIGILNQGVGTVSHHHTVANAQTIAQLNSFPQIKIIVTVRNIPDSLVSFHDHIVRDWTRHTDEFFWSYGYPNHILPFSTQLLFEGFIESDPDTRFEFLIDLFGTWYFAFLESWHRLAETHSDRVAIINYDTIADDPVSAFERMLEFLGAKIGTTRIEDCIHDAKSDRVGSNINVGRPGRGRDNLTTHNMDHLRRIGLYWNNQSLIDDFVN